MAPLLGLPTELYLQIVTYLDFPGRIALSQTNTRFRSIIKVERRPTPEQRRSFICAAECWPRYNDKYSCSRCTKLLARSSFADNQLQGPRAKGHAERHRRFCLDCGVRHGIYGFDQTITVNGNTHYICGVCFKVRDAALYCHGCGGCEDCLDSAVAPHQIKCRGEGGREGSGLGNSWLRTLEQCKQCPRAYLTPAPWDEAIAAFRRVAMQSVDYNDI
ncbi:hypothetical protein BDV18DRAFT_148056 [Aspergillus unguis]